MLTTRHPAHTAVERDYGLERTMCDANHSSEMWRVTMRHVLTGVGEFPFLRQIV